MKSNYNYHLIDVNIGLLLLLAVFGCNKAKSIPLQVKDNEMTIQIMRLPDKSSSDNSYTYKARVIPAKKLMDEKNHLQSNEMIFQMDSCFYLQSGYKKAFAELVQPIANGAKDNYEYLLQFDATDDQRIPVKFIYQDRCFNHKTYTIKIN